MVYPHDFERKTGFDQIRAMTAEKCLSPAGAEHAFKTGFSNDYDYVRNELMKTLEFQQILSFDDPFPAVAFSDIKKILEKLRIEGTFPETEELSELKGTLDYLKSVLNYFKATKEGTYLCLKSVVNRVKFYPFVSDAIDRIIDKHGVIRDNASPVLRKIRSEIASRKTAVTGRLMAILKQAQSDGIVDADANISVRNGREVIPVSISGKRRINGLIHDQSATGKTVFIEPSEIVEMNNEIIGLGYEERREIVKILTSFADSIRSYIDDLIESFDFLSEIDFIKARAMLGNELGSILPSLSAKPLLSWKKAVHPLLFKTFRKAGNRNVVPLDIELNDKHRILLVSGPNAGGKSVCLKTTGLLQYMLQCGYTIPVGEGSEAGIFNDIFIDIGDEQSIENDLSTYSSHLVNMKFFIRNASPSSLVLIDELGSGTEPVLGGAIAEAILAELIKIGTYGVITTHYFNLKHFASVTDGIINGAMLFDNTLMQPLFRLDIGKPGSSFAFEIARKIGLPENILQNASEKAGVKIVKFDRHLKDIARDKRYWEMKRQNIRKHEKRLEELIDEYEKELSGTKALRKEIISKAREEAKKLLEDSNRIIENTVRQIKESQAEKERTLKARQEIAGFKQEVEGMKEEKEITGKPLELKRKASGIVKRVREKRKQELQTDSAPLKPGDAVRLTDTGMAGEVTEADGDNLIVETGTFRLKVSASKVERISRKELKKGLTAGRPLQQTDPLVNERKLRFKPEIDIRGVRGDEALEAVRNLIDDAVMVQHRHLRIIHGKGNGILRNLIRQYLSTMPVVKSARDEHVELGGAGVTLVELDL